MVTIFMILGYWVVYSEDFINLNYLHGRKDHIIEVRSYLPVQIPGLSVKVLDDGKAVEVKSYQDIVIQHCESAG